MRNGAIDISGDPVAYPSGNLSDASGYAYSEINSFITSPELDISTNGVTNLTSLETTLNGLVELNPHGALQYGFVWDLSNNYPGHFLEEVSEDNFLIWPDKSDNSFNFVPDISGVEPSGVMWSFSRDISFNKLVGYYYRAFGKSQDLSGGLNLDGYIYGDAVYFMPPPTCGWPTYNPSPAESTISAERAEPVTSFYYERTNDHYIDGKRTGYDIKLFWTNPLFDKQGILLERSDVNKKYFRNASAWSGIEGSSDNWNPSDELDPILKNLKFEVEYIFTIKTYTHNSTCQMSSNNSTLPVSGDSADDKSYSTGLNLSINDYDRIQRIEDDRCPEVPKDALQIQLDPNFNAIPKKIAFAFLAKNPVGTGKHSTRNIVCKEWKPPTT